jgi:undecaprenyl-diphosphatase
MLFCILENLRNISTERLQLILKSNENIQLFLIGNVVAFIVAIIAIKFFIEIIKNTVSNHGAGTNNSGDFLLIYFIYLK